MRDILINIYSFANLLWIKIFAIKADIYSGLFFKVKIHKEKENVIKIENSQSLHLLVNLIGTKNTLTATDAYISNTSITINGANNHLYIGQNVKLRGATIIVRGDGCTLKIGKNTTFGGIRIVNVGSNNEITIGEDCLFSDHIELWASDTHKIFNNNSEYINPAKPVTIGNNVWIGSRVIILKGVTISNGSIVGMGSVVTKDVAANVISAGYPSRTIKEGVTWEL